MYIYIQRLVTVRLARSSGVGRVISNLVQFADTILTVSSFFRILLDETIANSYFLEPYYCSGQLIDCLEVSGNKNNLRTTLG